MVGFITPSWVLMIPDRTDKDYFDYLLNQAPKDGMPSHVRKHLIIKYVLDEYDDTYDL